MTKIYVWNLGRGKRSGNEHLGIISVQTAFKFTTLTENQKRIKRRQKRDSKD